MTEVISSTPSLGERIQNITRDINTLGIKKNVDIIFSGKKFKGRGIDDIVMSLTPLFSKHNLILSFEVINITDIGTSIIVQMEYKIHDSNDLSNYIKYSVCGEGQKSNSARAVQIAQTYALKTFFSQAFFVSEGWDEPQNDIESVQDAQSLNDGFTHSFFPEDKLHLVEEVSEQVSDSHSLSDLLKVFEKYKHDFMRTDKEEEFVKKFTIRRQQLKEKMNESN